MAEADLTKACLMYFVVPLWIAAGFADWLCHRASHIERNAGARESLLHLLLLGESSIPVLAALFLEINAGVLALALTALVLHQITAMVDVGYATTVRVVTPNEQHVHGFLEVIPLMAMVLVVILHWPQFLSLFGLGPERADFSINLKDPPLPLPYLVAVLAAIFLLDVAPYLEELWRCLRASRPRLRAT